MGFDPQFFPYELEDHQWLAISDAMDGMLDATGETAYELLIRLVDEESVRLGLMPSPEEWEEMSRKADLEKSPQIHPGYVYLIKSGDHYKIGRSINPNQRCLQFSITLPIEPILLHKILTNDMVWLETHLHEKFSDRRGRGEWFTLTEDDVKSLQSLRHWPVIHKE